MNTWIMEDNFHEKYVSKILLINGIADVLIALGMVFAGSLMGATTGLEFYAAGGWGIATFALGMWRIWASRNPTAYWFTALGGIVEGGILVLYSIMAIFLYSLLFADIAISLFFGFTFFILYVIAFILKNKKK